MLVEAVDFIELLRIKLSSLLMNFILQNSISFVMVLKANYGLQTLA